MNKRKVVDLDEETLNKIDAIMALLEVESTQKNVIEACIKKGADELLKTLGGRKNNE